MTQSPSPYPRRAAAAPTPTPEAERLPRPPTPRRRGGARPGAGAPKGNLNALKHSRFSKDMVLTQFIFHLFPEVERYVKVMLKARTTQRQDAYRDAVLDHMRRHKPHLTDSIELQSIQRFTYAVHQIRQALPDADKNYKTTTQSNPVVTSDTPAADDGDFDFIPILDAIAHRANRTGIWHPNAFDDDDFDQ